MAGSNTSAAPQSASATSPTTSPAASSNQAASETSYTLGCDEPNMLPIQKLGLGATPWLDRNRQDTAYLVAPGA